MSMHGKNDRSVHSDHRKISRNLARHAELMKQFEAKGMQRIVASRLAFDVVCGKKTEAQAQLEFEASR
jgi:hypothetical protein